jgi:CRISPR-associated protein Cas5d
MPYEVALEVAGPLAMFARPDTGGTPTSYTVPTWSACKGIFECIAFFSSGDAWINPYKVEICKRVGEAGGRINLQRYTTNYGGPLRKKNVMSAGLISGGSSMQLFATVLTDVCYRIYGQVEGPRRNSRINARHHLQELFNRRLKRGQCAQTPALGWKEFTCSYWGPFREGLTEVDTAINLDVPSMLLGVWSRPTSGSYQPTFCQDVQVANGVLHFELPANWRSANGGAN